MQDLRPFSRGHSTAIFTPHNFSDAGSSLVTGAAIAQDLTGKLAEEVRRWELMQLVERPLDKPEAAEEPVRQPREDAVAVEALSPDVDDQCRFPDFKLEDTLPKDTLPKPIEGHRRKLSPIKPKPGQLRQQFGTCSTPSLHGDCMSEEKAALESRRAWRLAVHRAVSPPSIYRQYKQAPERDGHDFRPHDEALVEKRSHHRRVMYQNAPSKLPGGHVRVVGGGERKEVTSLGPHGRLTRQDDSPLQMAPKRVPHGHSRSATQLPALGSAPAQKLSAAAALGRTNRRPPKTRQPSGYDVLKKLREGALPGILVPPI
uniref:Uncharacterized protein n=1 Tax=Alexandrium catenella TaxID=2925 RepID=A0A7S1WS30_ALECA